MAEKIPSVTLEVQDVCVGHNMAFIGQESKQMTIDEYIASLEENTDGEES